MSIEDRLTRALAAEAETVDVDVEDLRARTRERLRRRRPRARAAPDLEGPALLAAAASVALATAAVTFLATGGVSDRPPTLHLGDVDLTFSCPAQRDIDVTFGCPGRVPPPLGRGGPAAVADEYDAPRWDFAAERNRATPRLGNDDGLGSITTYRAPGRWGRSRRSRAIRWTPESPLGTSCGWGRTATRRTSRG